MKNQTVETKLGVAIIIIVAITMGALAWKYEKNNLADLMSRKPIQTNKNTVSSQNSAFKVSDKWTLVSHYNFWNNPTVFPRKAYSFPNIEFSYPKNWKFACCNDTDNASTHTIYSSEEKNTSLPFISITDYFLTGCPMQQKSCSLDKKVKLTAIEKFGQLTSTISASDILPKIKLAKLNTSAFAYKKTESGNRFSEGYIINLGDGVVEIDFVNYNLLDQTFIENFLNHISFETK